MSCRKLVKVVVFALIGVSLIWSGILIEKIYENNKPLKKDKIVLNTTTESSSSDICRIEIWEDNGEVHIITSPQYINQLSDNTIIITDKVKELSGK